MSKVLKLGTVKWYSRKRGFGFIIPDEGGGPEVWFHIKQYDPMRGVPGHGEGPTPEQGERVLYQEDRNEQGPYALRVHPACEREDVCPLCGNWLP